MPKQRSYGGNVDESLHWFPRLGREDEDDTVLAPAGEKISARGELESGDGIGVVVECHLEFVSGNGHGRRGSNLSLAASCSEPRHTRARTVIRY